MTQPGQTLKRLCRTSLVLALCAIALSGCGKKDQAATSGQIVAHVGDDVITTQELENEFRVANIPANRQKEPTVVKQVLGELVLRKYMLQKALSLKLDREPNVLLDILRSREQTMASAYLSKSVAANPVSQAEVDKYIANNPLKFANRQMITAEQIAFPLGTTSQAAVDAGKEATSMDEVDQKLTVMGVAHNRSMVTFSSGEIPEDFFNVLQAKKADSVFFLRAGTNGVFLKVRGEESRPLDGQAAANLARQLLKMDRIKAETGMATVSANLEAKYEGEYAAIMSKESGPSVGPTN
jgi:EpsD family peptidyl-prolyl cis-trans isomerase